MARMPYTNFHDINLDWLIKRVMLAYTPDNPPPYPVKSVNGKTGVVQLTGGDIPFSEDSPQATVLDFCDYVLEQLENLNTDMASKQDAPVLAGSPGQVLSLDADQNPVWSNPAGGTDDYNDLQNKPQINGVTVSGNKTGSDFGLLNAALARMMYAPIITDTASGDPANFPDGIADMEMIVQAVINPVQDLHGYANPWGPGKGKNLLNYADYSDSNAITSITDNGLGEFTVIASASGAYVNHLINVEAGTTYFIKTTSTTNVSGNANQLSVASVFDGNNDTYTDLINHGSITNGKSFTPTGNVVLVRNYVTGGLGGGTGIINQPQVEKGNTATTYAPYSNICPIYGNAGLTLYTSGADISDPDVYLVAWGDVAGTIYGGTFNSKTGKLIVTDANIASYNGETLPSTWISDRDVYAPGIPPTTGAQVVYKIATPIEYTLYSFDINSLYGENNVWTDVGPVSVDYYADTKLYIDKQVAALQALILEI